MRKEVQKLLFVGLQEAKEPFFVRAQEEGLIHFIDGHNQKKAPLPEPIQKFTEAIRICSSLPTLPQEELSSLSKAEPLCETILSLHHRIDDLQEEQRILRLEVARIAPFGSFDLEELHSLERDTGLIFQFFWTKRHQFAEALPEGLIYVNSAHELDYFVAINEEKRSYPHAVEMQIEQPLKKLQVELHRAHQEEQKLEQSLKSYQKYHHYLRQALIARLNDYELVEKQQYVDSSMEGLLFAVEGWAPVDQLPAVEQLSREMEIDVQKIALEPNELIPTYLENEKWGRVGEDLVSIYDTPSHTDKDPSLWVLCFFALFFSMIIGDGGYGLLFLALALYLRYRFGLFQGMNQRLWKLMVLLSVSCVAWGLLINSFFGISLPPDHPLMRVSLVNYLVTKKTAYHMERQDAVFQEWVEQYPQIATMTDPQQVIMAAAKEKNGSLEYELYSAFSDNIMLELALVIGMIHIMLSFARYLGRNPSGVGWIAFIIGCYLYFPSYLDATTMLQYLFHVERSEIAQEGLYLIGGGILAALFIGVLRHRLMGLLEIANLVQVFGDILSYLRLYALAMAGGIVSATINDFASASGFVGGFLLILAGHAFNISLSLIGGVIHGLRLNFLEWYHYSFEGGGYPFRPLKKIVSE